MTERKLKVNIGANMGGAMRGFRDLGAAADGMRGKVVSAAGAAGKGLAALAGGIGVAGAGAYKLAQNASDMAESVNRAGVVFGDSSEQVVAFAEDAATSYGISQVAAIEASAAFGQMFADSDMPEEELAAMSIELAQFAGDLSSFANITTDDAIAKVFSGLAGEIEPLRRVGVAMDAISVENKALEMGLADSADALTQADKTIARANLMMTMEASRNITGDFARTASDLAQQQRTLSAQIDNAKVAIGERFLPTFTKAIQYVNDNLPAMAAHIEAALDTAITKAGQVWEEYGPTITDFAMEIWDALKGLGEWALQNLPLFQEIAGIAFQYVANQIQFAIDVFQLFLPYIQRIVDYVLENLPAWAELFQEASGTARASFLDLAEKAIPFLIEVFEKLWAIGVSLYEWGVANWPAFQAIFEQVWGVIQTVVDTLVGVFESLWATLKQIIDDVKAQWPGMGEDLSGAVQTAWGLVETVINEWKEIWNTWGSTIIAVVIVIVQQFIKHFTIIMEILGNVVKFISGVLTGDWGKAWDALWGIVKGFWDLLVSTFLGAIDLLGAIFGNIGRKILDSLLGGIKSGWGAFKDLWNSTVGLIPGLAIGDDANFDSMVTLPAMDTDTWNSIYGTGGTAAIPTGMPSDSLATGLGGADAAFRASGARTTVIQNFGFDHLETSEGQFDLGAQVLDVIGKTGGDPASQNGNNRQYR